MSGLEVVGALASAAQLIHYVYCISQAIQEVHQKVRDGPQALLRFQNSLERLSHVAKLIQNNQVLQTASVHAHLEAINSKSGDLKKVLDKLAAKSPSLFKRYWKAWICTRVEKEIFNTIAQLEEDKSALLLCIAEIHANISGQVHGEIKSMNNDVESLLCHSTTFSMQMGTVHDRFPAVAQEINAMHTAISPIRSQIDAIHQEIVLANGRASLRREATMDNPKSSVLDTAWSDHELSGDCNLTGPIELSTFSSTTTALPENSNSQRSTIPCSQDLDSNCTKANPKSHTPVRNRTFTGNYYKNIIANQQGVQMNGNVGLERYHSGAGWTRNYYKNITSSQQAFQINGNMGHMGHMRDMGDMGDVYSLTEWAGNRYNSIQAHDNSRQINGNVMDVGFAAKFFERRSPRS